jgi:hypothetical protein
MPPNSTQNLNARLSLTRPARRTGGTRAFAARRLESPAARTKIVGGPTQYRGGYHLNV